jgi:hypothetical protein
MSEDEYYDRMLNDYLDGDDTPDPDDDPFLDDKVDEIRERRRRRMFDDDEDDEYLDSHL